MQLTQPVMSWLWWAFVQQLGRKITSRRERQRRRTADHGVGLLVHQDRREVTLDGVLGDGLDRKLRRQLRIIGLGV